MPTTLEFFGATTFRIKTLDDYVIFHDTWLDRPSNLPSILKEEEVKQADIILINHAHFDHCKMTTFLDRLQWSCQLKRCVPYFQYRELIQSPKIPVPKSSRNAEAIRVLRNRGVPESQLLAVAGGERIQLDNGIVIRPYPGLHCLMPFAHGEVPDYLPTDYRYEGSTLQSPADITEKMTKGLGGIRQVPDDKLPNDDFRAFKVYMTENWDRFSLWDGGCMMYNVEIPGEGTILINGHCGAYQGILSSLEPKPDVAILAIAGQPCVNGGGYSGTVSEFIVDCIHRLGEPKQVVWALHDRSPIPPYYIDSRALDEAVKKEATSEILTLQHAVPARIFVSSP